MQETCHLGKLGILHHHGMDDPEESFVAREESRSASEGVSLEHALAGVLRKDLDDAPTLGPGGDVPLKVPATIFEHGVQLVRYQLVGREDAETLRIP